MAGPVRIQRKRAKGWKMPPNTVYVGRGSIWGNPWRPQAAVHCEHQRVVDAFRRLFTQPPSYWRHMLLRIAATNRGRGEGAILQMKERLPELRGKNLACWCPPNLPCHADVLLELANATTPPTEE